MTLRQREKTFKQIGATLERAFKQIDEGMAIVDRFDEARDEKEREHFSLLVALSVHNSWQTITKIMRRIAIDVDHDMPKGSGAPNRLIDRMTERTSERPQIMSLRHLETIRQIGKFHRDFRSATASKPMASEMIDYLEMISDEIVPDIMENVRKLALASPGGPDCVGYLLPKAATAAQPTEVHA